MPHPKRQSSPNRKRMTERQIVLAHRSRSVKASLLKVLSLDLVTLYQADHPNAPDHTTLRNRTQPLPRQPSDFGNSAELHDATHITPPNPGTSIRPVAPSHETEPRQIQNRSDSNDSQVVSRSVSQPAIVIAIIRCCAFLLGVLIRCVLIFYVQPFAILLSGVAIVLSGVSVLIVVVFAPWKKKLLWNLSCLFGGLLLAVFIL